MTELLVPLSRARKWILVGDRNQLPPFAEAVLESPEHLQEFGLSREDLTRTLLDHLSDNLPDACRTRLTYQHRMIRPIGDLVSECFYDGELRSVKDDSSFDIGLAIPKPVTWFSTARLKRRSEIQAKPSYKNLAEVQEVLNIIRRLNWVGKTKGRHYSVAVLTGYGAQRLELERELSGLLLSLENVDVTCNTVDAFQGREADVAIYSVTRCNEAGLIGFLRERRRLNVALSRGKIGLVIVGDHVFCRSVKGQNPFEDVLQHISIHAAECALEEVENDSR